MQAQNLNNSLANIENLTSEKEIIEHAFTTDRKLRRAQVIVDWLEYNARKGKIGTSQGDRCFILRPNLHQSLNFPPRVFFKHLRTYINVCIYSQIYDYPTMLEFVSNKETKN